MYMNAETLRTHRYVLVTMAQGASFSQGIVISLPLLKAAFPKVSFPEHPCKILTMNTLDEAWILPTG
jgi:hypothetical protein